MQINFNLAREAIKLSEFQKFMLEEMKLSKEEVEKLKGCGGCWHNLSFTPRSVEKINTFLGVLEKEDKISIPIQYIPIKSKEYCSNLEEAKAYLGTLSDDDFKQIIIGLK